MVARTHNIISFAALVVVATYTPPSSLNFLTLLGALIANIVGTLSPDIDQASDKLWNLVPGGGLVGRIFRPFFLGHRNLSHSLLGTYIYFKVIKFVLWKILNPAFVSIDLIIAAMMIGFIAHLLADSITTEGVPLFFPIKIKVGFPPMSSLRIKTGSWVENWLVFPGVLIFLAWFGMQHRETLVSIVNLIHN
jgi:inner membrane protein